jgi:hypothetical protein
MNIVTYEITIILLANSSYFPALSPNILYFKMALYGYMAHYLFSSVSYDVIWICKIYIPGLVLNIEGNCSSVLIINIVL